MQFAMIISGTNAPAPAPRIAGAPSITGIGIFEPETGEIWQPDRDAIAPALPARLRKHVARDGVGAIWFREEARIEGGRCVPELPYMTIRNKGGGHLATVYFAPLSAESS